MVRAASPVKVFPMGLALITNGKIFTEANQALLASKDFYDHSAPFVVSVRVDTADGVVNIDSASSVFGSTTYSKVLFLSKTKHAKTVIKAAPFASTFAPSATTL